MTKASAAARHLRIAFLAATLLATSASGQDARPAAPAQADPDSNSEIVVTGFPPHCQPRPGDAQDEPTAAAPMDSRWRGMQADKKNGGYKAVERYYRRSGALTDQGVWRRAGDALPDFIFRVPSDGSPLCIGARVRSPRGSVQLQQLLHPGPYRCKYVRFTAFVATRRADAWLWLNNGGGGPMMTEIEGDHVWMPVLLQQGLVGVYNSNVSFGVVLRKGDVWFYKPQLEIVPDAELPKSARGAKEDCERRLALDRKRFPDRALPDE